MGGTADSGQAVGPAAPEDLVSVCEAAQAVGLRPGAVHAWVTRGRLPAHPSRHGRQVSLDAVRALSLPPDPEARPACEVARALRLANWHITSGYGRAGSRSGKATMGGWSGKTMCAPWLCFRAWGSTP